MQTIKVMCIYSDLYVIKNKIYDAYEFTGDNYIYHECYIVDGGYQYKKFFITLEEHRRNKLNELLCE